MTLLQFRFVLDDIPLDQQTFLNNLLRLGCVERSSPVERGGGGLEHPSLWLCPCHPVATTKTELYFLSIIPGTFPRYCIDFCCMLKLSL